MKNLTIVFVIKCLILLLLSISLPLLVNNAKSKEGSNKYPGYIDITAKPGSQRNIGELNLLAPLYQGPGSITFINLRGQTDSNDSSEINLGMGNR